jgi:nicotinamidase-related amidase
MAFTALDALREGYEVYPVVDAIARPVDEHDLAARPALQHREHTGSPDRSGADHLDLHRVPQVIRSRSVELS